MNTLVRSAATMTLTLVSAFTWAQTKVVASGAEVSVTTNTSSREAAQFDMSQLVQSLRQNDLKVETTGKSLTREQKVLKKLSHGVPPSREGIPGEDEEPSAHDLLQAGYATDVLIRRTMADAQRMPMGRRINYYESQIARILQGSGNQPTEEATRLVLNRTVDVSQNIIRWAGQNPELVAQFTAQFYQQSLESALGYLNNPPNYVDAAFPRAKVGIFYARILFSNHGTLVSDSAKAIILIKLVGYLGQDLNSDLRRRNTDYRYALLDIINLQQQDAQYNNILDSLQRGEEPRSSDLAGVRSQVSRILMNLPN